MSEVVDYDRVQQMLSDPFHNLTIIDARETSEFNAGHLPDAKNVPYISYPEAWSMTPSKFAETFRFAKPLLDAPILVYCQSGRRAAITDKNLGENHYTRRYIYKGSWNDWKSRR